MICPICNEDYMGCDRHGCWKDWAVLDNSKREPKKYSVVAYLVFGGLIALSMLTGVAVGFWGSHVN